MVDAHIVEGPARGVALLHKGGGAVTIHVGPSAASETGGAGVIELTQAAFVDEQLGRPRFRPE